MVTSCTSKWIRKSEDPLDDPTEKDLEGSVVENFSLAPGKSLQQPVAFTALLGSIWTFMLRIDEEDPENTCEIVFSKDSNSNDQNIFLMVPQYVVITVGEVKIKFEK